MNSDHLKSTLHHVTLPPASDRYTGVERITRARYSIPYFVSLDIDAVIECMKECSSVANPVEYEPVVQREYKLMRSKLEYPGKATLTAQGDLVCIVEKKGN
jgi:isopenicillin N synthase-like dioxygenase